MAEDINNKALRGSISQILLNALVSGDKYGYEICKDIEQKSNGKLLLKQPSLYSSLRRMEGQGLITSYWADSELGGRRHYYSITEKGKKHYEKKQVNWNEFGDLINALPSNKEIPDEESEIKQPANLEKQMPLIDTITKQADFGVVKQEDLFSMSKTTPIQKEDVSSGGETFIQFDMFAQKPNFIKTTNEPTNEVFSTFKSKYSTITGSIEPDNANAIENDNTEADDLADITDIEAFDDVLDLAETDENVDEVSENIAKEDAHETDDIFLTNDEIIDDLEPKQAELVEEKTEDINLDSFEEDFIETPKPVENATIDKTLNSLPKGFFDNTISDFVVNGKSNNVEIIDSSSKYSSAKKDFDNYSFIDKQQQEKYVPTSGKFAYTKDSENIYGGDFASIESESLKGNLADFLGSNDNKEDKSQEDKKDISSLFKFTNDDSEDVFVQEKPEDKKPTIDDVIPKPKALDEYDEVLKDHERIDVPLYTGSQSINTVEFVNAEDNGSFIQKPAKKENLDYKDKLADLYTDTSKINPYNKPLEEEIVSLDSEELFESPKPSYKPRFSSDIESLQEDLGKEGIKLKMYSKASYVKSKQDNYINYSLLSLIKGWIVWFIMLAEIIITAVVLHTNQLLPVHQVSFYYWAGGITLLYPIYYTIAYFIDPYRKIASTFKLNISLFNKFLAMLINIIFVFAINLFFGMTSLNQLSYLSYWLLPIILSSNYIISTLIYFILLKGKKFSI